MRLGLRLLAANAVSAKKKLYSNELSFCVIYDAYDIVLNVERCSTDGCWDLGMMQGTGHGGWANGFSRV